MVFVQEVKTDKHDLDENEDGDVSCSTGDWSAVAG